jgi:hypothetical protein
MGIASVDFETHLSILLSGATPFEADNAMGAVDRLASDRTFAADKKTIQNCPEVAPIVFSDTTGCAQHIK